MEPPPPIYKIKEIRMENELVVNDYEKKRMVKKERQKGQMDVLGWIIRQNEYAKTAEKMKITMDLKAGEIYEVDLGLM